jgi:hypothetical protein
MVGAFDTDPPPPVQTLQHWPTFVNVDNVPEDTYELDEINVFNVNPGTNVPHSFF